jgi:hypothetical protein
MEQKENGSDLHVLALQTNMQVSMFYKISMTAAIFYHLSLKEKDLFYSPSKHLTNNIALFRGYSHLSHFASHPPT